MEAYFDFREQWLAAGIDAARPMFQAAGYPLPQNIKVSCGWPVGSRGAKKILGQCFDKAASKAGAVEIFISPVLDDAPRVMGVLLHELVHAAVGNDAGHGPAFRAACAALGLKGRATEAMPGADLMGRIESEILPLLGAYPHASDDFSQRKKQGTRMIKLVCPVSGYTVRTTAKWIEQGFPISPAGEQMVPEE